eukprot:3515634-Heterocapsa_arctica.AAC.1
MPDHPIGRATVAPSNVGLRIRSCGPPACTHRVLHMENHAAICRGRPPLRLPLLIAPGRPA